MKINYLERTFQPPSPQTTYHPPIYGVCRPYGSKCRISTLKRHEGKLFDSVVCETHALVTR
jgi:hypothetical protein